MALGRGELDATDSSSNASSKEPIVEMNEHFAASCFDHNAEHVDSRSDYLVDKLIIRLKHQSYYPIGLMY